MREATIAPTRLFGAGAVLSAVLLLSACGESPTAPAPLAPDAPAAIRIDPGLTYVAVAAGGHHGCGLADDGSVFCWGRNVEGQTSAPTGTDFVQISAGGAHSCGLRSNGSLACWGRLHLAPASPPGGTDWRAVSSGGAHTCALRDDGTIDCWGWHPNGRTATPPGSDYVAVSAGGGHNCALRAGGSLYCWGFDFNGQARPPAGTDFVDVAAGSNHTCAVKADGSVVCWGYGYGSPGLFFAAPSGTDFVRVTSGSRHTCALRTDGGIECWGSGLWGESTPPPEVGFTGVSVGSTHSCALNAEGAIRCWGGNDQYQATPATVLLPEADFSAPSALVEGSAFELSLANPRVPGYDGEVSFTYSFSCGDAPYGPFGDAASADCFAADDQLFRRLSGRVRDDAGDVGEYFVFVRVSNADPEVSPLPDAELLVGESYQATGSFTDAGAADTHTATLDPGDSAGPRPLPLDAAAFTAAHTYTAAGAFTLVVTVTDDDGGSGSAAADVVVLTAQAALARLAARVGELVPGGEAAGLVRRLETAIGMLDAGRPDPALRVLDSFTREVAALAGRRIQDAAAAELIGYAERVGAAIRAGA